MSNSIVELLQSMPWFGWVGIVAIVSGSVGGVFKMSYAHRERMEMIRQGMHPDAAFAEVEKQRGKQFDPECASAFLAIRQRVIQEMQSETKKINNGTFPPPDGKTSESPTAPNFWYETTIDDYLIARARAFTTQK